MGSRVRGARPFQRGRGACVGSLRRARRNLADDVRLRRAGGRRHRRLFALRIDGAAGGRKTRPRDRALPRLSLLFPRGGRRRAPHARARRPAAPMNRLRRPRRSSRAFTKISSAGSRARRGSRSRSRSSRRPKRPSRRPAPRSRPRASMAARRQRSWPICASASWRRRAPSSPPGSAPPWRSTWPTSSRRFPIKRIPTMRRRRRPPISAGSGSIPTFPRTSSGIATSSRRSPRRATSRRRARAGRRQRQDHPDRAPRAVRLGVWQHSRWDDLRDGRLLHARPQRGATTSTATSASLPSR